MAILQKKSDQKMRVRWLTIDIFCGDAARYEHISRFLETERVATAFAVPTQTIKRFDIAELNVVKISFPRPTVQGTRNDRDMHGAAWAVLLAEMTLPEMT